MTHLLNNKMIEEKIPFLKDQTLTPKYMIMLFPVLIILCSTIKFFFSTNGVPFVVNKDSWVYIIPFIMNIFTEEEVPNLLINPIFSVILTSLLLKKWNFSKIMIFSLISSSVANAASFLILSIFSQIPNFPNFSICGSLSLNVSLSVALCYAYRPEKIPIFGGLSLRPTEIFYVIALWSFCCFRWPPCSLISALLSFLISFLMLTKMASALKLPRAEGDFNIKSFLAFQKEETKPVSILDSLNLQTGQELSEADQSRRMRALRAIEERLESLQNNK